MAYKDYGTKEIAGADSKTTMDQVRAHHGDDALIISTNKIGNKTEMICAVEELQTQTALPNQSANDSAESLDISEAIYRCFIAESRRRDAAAEGMPAGNFSGIRLMSASLESSAKN